MKEHLPATVPLDPDGRTKRFGVRFRGLGAACAVGGENDVVRECGDGEVSERKGDLRFASKLRDDLGPSEDAAAGAELDEVFRKQGLESCTIAASGGLEKVSFQSFQRGGELVEVRDGDSLS